MYSSTSNVTSGSSCLHHSHQDRKGLWSMSKKKQVLNTCYLPCHSKPFHRSPHLFQRRDRCRWLGSSNVGQTHLVCAEGDIPTPLSVAPNLVLAKASCPLFSSDYKHAKCTHESEPFHLLLLILGMFSLQIFKDLLFTMQFSCSQSLPQGGLPQLPS